MSIMILTPLKLRFEDDLKLMLALFRCARFLLPPICGCIAVEGGDGIKLIITNQQGQVKMLVGV